MRVFYPDTELECCGTPFAVGDEIAWRLDPADARDELYGAEARVDHHTGPDRETLGRVHAIELVHQQYVVHTDPRLREQIDRALRPDPGSPEVVLLPSPYTWEPVPGARTLEPVTTCPQRFDQDEPRLDPAPQRIRRTTGALVTLDTTTTRPLPPRAAPEAPHDEPDQPTAAPDPAAAGSGAPGGTAVTAREAPGAVSGAADAGPEVPGVQRGTAGVGCGVAGVAPQVPGVPGGTAGTAREAPGAASGVAGAGPEVPGGAWETAGAVREVAGAAPQVPGVPRRAAAGLPGPPGVAPEVPGVPRQSAAGLPAPPGVPREAGVAPSRARGAVTPEHPDAAAEPVGAAPYEPGDRR
ncbi:DUF6578 domain-containing protein [Streptomyces sp. P10-4]|uniref:DUF6578 domain-containing protein n=1 Tax=Streptomyces sp. P10-4 TaxID=3421645 RepID=UPI003D2A5447